MSDNDPNDPNATQPATPPQSQTQAEPAPGAGGPGRKHQFKPPRSHSREREREPMPTVRDELAMIAPKVNVHELDQDLDSELEAAMGGLNEEQIYGDMNAHQKKTPPGPPGPKKGRVLLIHGADVFLEIPGHRIQGVLPIMQFPDGPPEIGTEVEVEVEGVDNANGLMLLTRKGAAVEADWSSVAEGQIVEARVTATNKGGLEVQVNNIRGFMPISQIELFRVENVEPYVNQRFLCLVTEVDVQDRNLVVSRRALLEKDREQSREKLWTELAEGQVREGVVRSVRDFGAFIDLGGVDGLLHVSEMSWKRVEKPEEVLQPGQRVQVQVVKIDHERRKIGLSLKALQASPWDAIEQTYPVGSIVKGKVTKIMDFGAFIELEPGIEGLAHISELANHRVRRVVEVVQAGQEIDVMILAIDRDHRKIGLSVKAAQARKQAAVEEEEEEEIGELPPPRAPNPNLRGGIGSRKVEPE